LNPLGGNPQRRLWLTVLIGLSLVLFAATLLPFVAGMSGPIYLAAAIVLGSMFCGYAWRLWRRYSDQLARKTFRFSIVHLSLLFAARVAYRIAQVYLVAGAATQEASNAFVRSPLTLAIFGTLVGYYVAYAVGLLRWRRRVGLDGSAPAAGQDGT